MQKGLMAKINIKPVLFLDQKDYNPKDLISSFKNAIMNYLGRPDIFLDYTYPLTNPLIESIDHDVVKIRTMSAFGEAPYIEQEKMFCKLTGIDENDIETFIYSKKGNYILCCTLKATRKPRTIDIKMDIKNAR